MDNSGIGGSGNLYCSDFQPISNKRCIGSDDAAQSRDDGAFHSSTMATKPGYSSSGSSFVENVRVTGISITADNEVTVSLRYMGMAKPPVSCWLQTQTRWE